MWQHKQAFFLMQNIMMIPFHSCVPVSHTSESACSTSGLKLPRLHDLHLWSCYDICCEKHSRRQKVWLWLINMVYWALHVQNVTTVHLSLAIRGCVNTFKWTVPTLSSSKVHILVEVIEWVLCRLSRVGEGIKCTATAKLVNDSKWQ